MTRLTPFLVADRPASLRIIRGSEIQSFDRKIGIMTHANVSNTVQNFMKKFPLSDGFYEDPKFKSDNSLNKKGKLIKKRTIKMCDSGVFNKDGSDFDNYEDLFETYEKMDIDYGIILDVLNDKDATLSEAEKAINIFDEGNYNFNLMGVAQGKSIEDYLECYTELNKMGYEHIGVGGLLSKKGDRPGTFANVKDEKFMYDVLRKIREEHPKKWIFALGCYNPSRHSKLESLDIFGSDYKGWIFKYKPKNELGKEQARKWRYKQIRSFIKTNILTNGYSKKKNRLLLISCSKSKKKNDGFLKAIERYNGVAYKVFKKWQRENTQTHDLDMLILSAEYGLIPPSYYIEWYDKKLSKNESEDLKKNIDLDLKNYLRYRNYDEVFLHMGKDYRTLMKKSLDEVLNDEKTKIIESEGKIGEKLHELKNWLNKTKHIMNT